MIFTLVDSSARPVTITDLWGSIRAASAAIEDLRRAQAKLLQTEALADLPFSMQAAWIHRRDMLPQQ